MTRLIEDLISYVDHLNLSKNLNDSLISKLKNAENAMEKGKTDRAVRALNNFSKEVQAQRTKRNITEEEAGILISKVEEIMGHINP